MADKQMVQQSPGNEKETNPRQLTYKIAFPTANGKTITSHFGRAKYFLVVEIQGKNIVSQQLRENDSHKGMPRHHRHHHDHDHHHHSHDHNYEENHAYDPVEEKMHQTAHSRLSQILDDVDIIIATQMGPRAYQDFSSKGYTIILTGIRSIDDALKAYLDGKLKIS